VKFLERKKAIVTSWYFPNKIIVRQQALTIAVGPMLLLKIGGNSVSSVFEGD
jgi:hypothetical protein